MSENNMQLTVLGTRGSMAVSRDGFRLFGGSTSCYMVQAGEETVFLDAGSGLLSAPTALPKPPVILLSHLHLDHLLGLGMYSRLSRPGLETRICLPADSRETALAQLNGLYAPPFWPLSLKDYAGHPSIEPLALPLALGELQIDGIPGCHPGGCLVLRLRFRGKTLIYATDYEYSEASFPALVEFSRNADLLMFDGQYTEEEYASRKGFGHATPQKGLELMERSGAKQLLLIHHDPSADDETLLAREAQIARANVRYAREGEKITV